MPDYDARIVVSIPDSTGSEPGPVQTWLPVIGGAGGESGQVYHYQSGSYRISNGVMHLWGYIQFRDFGTIVGNLVLKGLPKPIAMIPHFVGGMSSYFSNVHPNSPVQIWFRGSGGSSFFWMDGEPLRGNNPIPMTVDDINPATQIIFYLCYPVD
jgi:hypothetical protein